MNFLLRSWKMGLVSMLLVSAGLIAEGRAPAAPVQLNIVTFNLKWFGLGGSMDGSPAEEKRNATLKKFIQEKVMPADVISFQEVVDVPRLASILPTGWKCSSYQRQNPIHQYVVLCYSNQYDLRLVDYDNNNTIEAVASDPERSRPAVRMNLTTKQGRALLTIVGVHLKAYPEESETRESQSEKIADDLDRNNSRLPILITGDFNTYPTSQNGRDEDDLDILLEGLNQGTHQFKLAAHNEYTYRSGSRKSKFDHFYISGNIKAIDTPDAFDVCSQKTNGKDFFDIKYYNKNVSDHCPVKIKVQL